MEPFHSTCTRIRGKLLSMSNRSRSSHIGSALSIVEILVYLFTEEMDTSKKKEERDIFILSKGHASSALYAVLNELKRISDEDLSTYYTNGSYLIGHVNHRVEGIDFSTGSLGHGLSVAAGYALGYKLSGRKNKVYCLLGDGECDEGSVWEALRFIIINKLDNITAIIDHNKLQGYAVESEKHILLKKMVSSLPLNFIEIGGHDYNEIRDAFSNTTLPKIILANTVKGKGISFMEDRIEWHYKSVSDEDLARAQKEV